MNKWVRFKGNLKEGIQIMGAFCLVIVLLFWPMLIVAMTFNLWLILLYIPYAPVLYALWKTFVE